MPAPQTMFDKIWQRHVVATEQDETLLYVARCLIHEGSSHTFDRLDKEGRTAAEPGKVFAFSDHYVPTTNQKKGLAGISDPKIRNMVEMLTANCKKHGIRHFNMGDADQGILHIAGPEQGISIPGVVLVGADHPRARHAKARVTAAESVFFPGTTHLMGFHLRNSGLHIILDKALAPFVRREVARGVDSFLAGQGRERADITRWVMHPGGRRIIEVMAEKLGLEAKDLAPTEKVLSEHGNMSSVTVLFVLDQILRCERPRSGERGLLGAFGPGFGAEFALVEFA